MSTARTCGDRGFTLIELALVLVILGFVFVLAFPRFSSFFASDALRADSVHLAETVRKLRKYSVASSLPVQLTLRMREGTWKVEAQDAEGRWFPPEDLPFTDGALSPGCRLRRVSLGGEKEASGGEVSIRFYPSGDADEAYLTFSGPGGEERTLHIHPTLNRVDISHERLENRGS